MTDKTHLLLIGSPRSGTTLLSAMLSCHPDIALLNEEPTGASFNILSKRIIGNKLCVPHQIELEQSRGQRPIWWLRAQGRRVVNIGRRALGRPVPLGGFMKSRLSIRDYQARADHFHLIGIVRSPAAVIASIQARGNQDQAVAEHRWRRLIEILHQLAVAEGGLAGQGKTKVTLVSFDHLVSQPEATLKRALAALDCDFTPAVLEGYRHTTQYLGRTEIDPAKASAGLAADLEHPLLVNDPALRAKYVALVEAAL